MRLSGIGLTICAALLAAIAMQPAAAAGYPDKSVKIVVPFAPAGPTDVMARLIAQKLSENLKQQFYIENHAGAGGNLGMTQVAKSAPDGYTILVASSSYVVNPSLYAKNPYDPFKDFAPVTLAAASPNILTVHPDIAAKTVKELIDLLKANPGKYTIANPGVGTTPQLAAELFKLSLKIDATSVPFGGAGPAIQSAVAGHTPIAFSALPPTAPQVQGGKLRPGGDLRQALLRLAGCADHGGGRRYGSGIRDHAGHPGAGRNAEGDRRSAQSRDRESHGAAGREGEMRPARLRCGGEQARGVRRLHQEGGREVGQGDQGSEHPADQVSQSVIPGRGRKPANPESRTRSMPVIPFIWIPGSRLRRAPE